MLGHALALARAEPQLDHLSGGVAADEIARCALGRDTSAVHDHQPVAQLLGLVHVVGGQHQRDPVGLQPVKAVPEGVAGLGVEARGGLVEQQQLGLVDQGPGDRQAPLHPARQRIDPVIGPVRQLGELDEALDAGSKLAPGQVEVATVDVEVLPHRQLQVQVVLLGHDPEPAPDSRTVAIRVEPEDP